MIGNDKVADTSTRRITRMSNQVKTFALLTGLRGAASIRLRPQQKSRSSVRKRSRCASHSMFSVPRDFRLSRRYGRLKSARKILENQIRN